MDNINKFISRLDNSRIVVIVSVIYVIVITALGMYLYMKFNEKERYDRRFVKRLEDHKSEGGSMFISNKGFHNPLNPDNKRIIKKDKDLIYPVSIVNCHIKTAFNCCAVNTYRNSWVSIEALKYCLEIGMKCLDFEIYSVNSKPVIGLNSREKNIDMKESFNKIPLEDVITAIRTYSSSNSSSSTARSVKDLPLILHFRIKTKQKDTLKTFAQQITLLDERFNEKYNSIIRNNRDKCFIHNYLYNENGGINDMFKRKIIVIANFSSIFNEGEIKKDQDFYRDYISDTNIDTAVNLISPSKFCSYITNYNAETIANDNNNKPLDSNKLTLSAPFSDFEGSCLAFNPDNVQKAGVQLIGLCAEKNLQKNENEMVNNYFKLFSIENDVYVSYIAKKSNLEPIYT